MTPATPPLVGSAAPAPGTASPASGPRPLRLMYVEDNRINAMLFSTALQLHGGFELRLAGDGEEALLLVRDWTPEVLVLDANLPDTNGFDLLGALRGQPGLGNTPAFMCSADAMPEDRRRAAEAGFIGYWAKPIDIGSIVADIRRVASRDGDVLAL